MALINCPECGKEVSDKAEKCLNCGYPLQPLSTRLNNTNENQEQVYKMSRKISIILNICVGVLGFLLFCGIVSSDGGFSGNQNASIIAWGSIVGAIINIIYIHIKKKVLAVLMGVPYIIAVITCANSLKISSAYILVEFLITASVLTTLFYMKKIHAI
ncbi:zinc ribbon domain-containing protein [Enterocloster citroniae]|uniref:zinc ribbon domain-containing protein n=1 Tax=Enterocloster citroniae TaxID=358743 RepID=UPI002E795F3F|nr:zinc ribbon domain-containing protein [Enterocloster citroniae]